MLSLASGCVVITGGGGLLGRGLALAFARRGASVVVADVNGAAAQAVAAEAAAVRGARALAVTADVTDRASMDALAETACDAFGAVRVLCNNAGVAVLRPFAELTPQDWTRVLDIQLWGVLNGTYAFLPRLIAQPERSHIVNTSSMSGVGRADLRTGNAPYVTAKFAVTGLSEVMRRRWRSTTSAYRCSAPASPGPTPPASRLFRCRAPTGTATTCCRRTR